MIYLKNLNSQIREFKDRDTKTVDEMVSSGRWIRVQGRKDMAPYSAPKKVTKKRSKKK